MIIALGTSNPDRSGITAQMMREYGSATPLVEVTLKGNLQDLGGFVQGTPLHRYMRCIDPDEKSGHRELPIFSALLYLAFVHFVNQPLPRQQTYGYCAYGVL